MISDDWSINYSAKTITHSSGTTVYTVQAFYSWLQDTFDELDQLDDPVPMSAQTPTEYSLINGWDFGVAATDVRYLKTGAITRTSDDTVWANIYTLGTIESGTTLYVEQDGAVLSGIGDPAYSSGHIDCLIKVKDAGSLIDSGNLTVLARELGDLYDYFPVTAPNGRNAVPVATSADTNDDSSGASVTGITLGYTGYTADINDDGADESYDTQIDCGGNTLLDTYRYLKYLTRRGSTTTVDGVQGQIYKIAGSGYTPVKQAPFGSFAGGVLFGARGVLLTNMAVADANSYILIDSSGTTRQPPATVGVEVNAIADLDRVAVFRLTAAAGSIATAEYTTAASGNASGSGTVTVTTAITADTPASGSIRLGSDGKRYAYASYTGSVFTLTGTLAETRNSTNCFVPFIDAQSSSQTVLSKSIKYQGSVIPVLVRVRQKGILPFEVESSITSAGMAVSAIRTTDSVVI